MKWQALLNHIDYYVYSHQTEKIDFLIGEYTEIAKNNYNHILSTYGINNSRKDAWAFDVALDCIRTMPVADRAYISNHTDAYRYHFSYALEIRNKYIHVAKKRFASTPDDLSSRVMQMIFAILSTDYVLK